MKFKKLLDALSLTQPIFVTTWHEGNLVDNFKVNQFPSFDERCKALGEAKVHFHGIHASKLETLVGYLFIDLEV